MQQPYPSLSNNYAFPAHWFLAQLNKPAFIEPADPADMSPILRSVCVTDGTVTRLLSAYYLDDVDVRICHQDRHTANQSTEPFNWLLSEPNDIILKRSVQLVGKTGRVYAHAFSHCNISALPTRITDSLEESLQNIGQALLKYLPDNNRQLLWYGWMSTEKTSQYMPGFKSFSDSQKYLCRSYLVRQNQKPLMQIIEAFPENMPE